MAGSLLTCPECNSTLKLAARLGAGQKIRCPNCKEVFSPRASIQGPPSRSKAEDSDLDPRSRKQRAEEDRPRRRRRARDERESPDRTGKYVLFGSLGLVVLAGGVL